MKNGRHSGSVTPTGALHPKQPGLPTMDICACVWPWTAGNLASMPHHPMSHQPKSALGGAGRGSSVFPAVPHQLRHYASSRCNAPGIRRYRLLLLCQRGCRPSANMSQSDQRPTSKTPHGAHIPKNTRLPYTVPTLGVTSSRVPKTGSDLFVVYHNQKCLSTNMLYLCNPVSIRINQPPVDMVAIGLSRELKCIVIYSGFINGGRNFRFGKAVRSSTPVND